MKSNSLPSLRVVHLVTINGDINIGVDSSITASWLVDLVSLGNINLDGTITTGDTNYQEPLLLVNNGGTIDPSSTIDATVDNGVVNVKDYTSGSHSGIINITGTLSGSGILQANGFYTDIYIINNSDNNLNINNLITNGTGQPGQIIVNSVPVTEDIVTPGGTITVVSGSGSGTGIININNNTGSDILLSGIVSGDIATITNTGGNILSGTTDHLIQADNITLMANNGSIGGVDPVRTDLTGGGLSANISKNLGSILNITEVSGDLSVKTINSLGSYGTIKLSTLDGSIINYDASSNIHGRYIELYSSNDIGSVASPLNINSNWGGSNIGYLKANAGYKNNKNIYIKETSGDLAVKIINENGSTGTVSLTTVSGDIRNADANSNIHGRYIELNSSKNIGSASSPLNINSNWGGSNIGYLKANISQQLGSGLYIKETSGDLAIKLINQNGSYGTVSLSTVSGDILNTDAYSNIHARYIELNSSGNIGNAASPLNVNSNWGGSNIGYLKANAGYKNNKNIYIKETSGDLAVKIINENGSTGTVNLTTVNGDIRNADAYSNIHAKYIKLNSGKNIGSLGNPLNINSNWGGSSDGSLQTSSMNSVYIKESSGKLNLNTINSTTGNVNLISNAEILTTTVLPTINITGVNVDLTSAIQIGSASNPIEVDATGTVNANAPVIYVHEN